MERRTVADILIAVVASGLISFGLLQALGDLGWETALGLGLLLTATIGFGLPALIQALPLKVLLAMTGVVLILLPAFRV